jgi:hypothetical protein
MFKNYLPSSAGGPGQHSRYSAGRYGDRIPVGARLSTPVQTGAEAQPASYTMGTGSFPGLKQLGRGVYHPPHLAPSLKKEHSYNLLFGPLWLVLGTTVWTVPEI